MRATAKRKPSKAIQRRKVPHGRPVRQQVPIRTQAPTIAEAIEQVLIGGDLTPLTPQQRLEYYRAVCKSLGLNPLTRPFDYIAFGETENAPAKLVLYARKDCTEQLRKIHGVAVTHSTFRTEGDMYIFTVEVKDKQGRTDAATGVVSLSDKYNKPLIGKYLANAIMRAETKAKRRATLSISGLGMLDESEIEGLDNVGMLTPGGRIMYEVGQPAEVRSLEAATESYDANNEHLKKAQEREQEQLAKLKAQEPAPALFYTHHRESDTYEITGPTGLMSEHRELLKPMWSRTANAVVANGEQLEGLKWELEKRGVLFRPLKAAGE